MSYQVWLLRSIALFIVIVTGLAIQVAKSPGTSIAALSAAITIPVPSGGR